MIAAHGSQVYDWEAETSSAYPVLQSGQHNGDEGCMCGHEYNADSAIDPTLPAARTAKVKITAARPQSIERNPWRPAWN
jgi:hypothetical protein